MSLFYYDCRMTLWEFYTVMTVFCPILPSKDDLTRNASVCDTEASLPSGISNALSWFGSSLKSRSIPYHRITIAMSTTIGPESNANRGHS